MPAPKGSKNAEKWTVDSVRPILEEIMTYAKNEDCLWLGEALVKVGLYKQVWSYWKRKFRDEEVIFEPIKRVEQVFENRLFVEGIIGELNVGLTILILKNNYDWK